MRYILPGLLFILKTRDLLRRFPSPDMKFHGKKTKKKFLKVFFFENQKTFMPKLWFGRSRDMHRQYISQNSILYIDPCQMSTFSALRAAFKSSFSLTKRSKISSVLWENDEISVLISGILLDSSPVSN
jgi:hypothetical protein